MLLRHERSLPNLLEIVEELLVTTAAALQTSLSGGSDAVVARFNFLRLAVITQPTTTVVGTAIAPGVGLAVQNLDGSTYPSYTGSLVVRVLTGTGAVGAVLGGTLTRAVTGGVASFADLTLNQPGSGYRLLASAANNLLDPAVSSGFDVITGTGTLLLTLVGGSPQSAVTNTVFGQPLKVRVTNYAGTAQAGVVVTFTAPSSGASGLFTANSQPVYGGTSDAGGYVSSPAFQANAAVGSYFVAATAVGVANSVNFILNNLADSKFTSFSLTLDPPVAGPNLLSTTLTLTATLKQHGVTPVVNVPITFDILGDVGTTPLAYTQATNSLGQAVISYSRTLTNNDQILASTKVNSLDVQSKPAYAYWLTPKNEISESMVHGTFFAQPSPASGGFSATKESVPLFTQDFTGLRFNNVQGWFGWTNYCGISWEPDVPISPCSTPFQHANYDVNGRATGIDIAQGNGYRAREGSLTEFNAVFTGTLVVNKSGWVTLKFLHDDGMFWGVGSNQNGAVPTADSANTREDLPASGRTPFRDLPIMAGKNNPTLFDWAANKELIDSPTIAKIYFPEPGLYPYEIDYAQVTGGFFASLTTQVVGTNIDNLLQVGTLTISPASVTAQAAGSPVTFTVQALNPSGQPASNLIVTLSAYGVNSQDWQGLTDVNGVVTFMSDA